ncbi:MAG: hypothetical protein JWR50_1671 [Mucilaginibacter sp.]|nr:hypothetical protein [Mucilaginibacter sp.]
METYFEISESGNKVRVDVIEFIKPGNFWLRSKVTVKAGVFSGEYFVDFEASFFESFKEKVSDLYDNFLGGAMFYDEENHLEIRIYGNGRGKFEVDVKASDNPYNGGYLSFKMNIDQTYIMPLVKSLNHITKAFPVSTKINKRN